MISFDIEDKPGTWYDLGSGARIQLRNTTREDFKELRKQTTTKMSEIKRIDGVLERVAWEEKDEDLHEELFWDKVIVDWEGIVDAKGLLMPCTRENKVKLMLRSAKFAKMVNDSFKILTDAEAAELETAEKN